MAFPTAVNSQITDATTQSSVQVVGGAPAQALATLYQVAGQAAGLAMENAVSNQQNLNEIGRAATAAAVKSLLKGDGPELAAIAKKGEK